MSKSYEELMDRIEMTDEMRERVLENAIKATETEKQGRVIQFRSWKKIMTIAACAVIVVAGTTALPDIIGEKEPTDDMTQVVMTEEICSSAEDLSETAGFVMKEIENIPFEVEETEYRFTFGELAEITYTGSDNRLTIRKSESDGDISGDTNEYSNVTEKTAGKYAVTLKGNENGYVLATWTYEKYAFALYADVEIPEENMLEMIVGIE